MKNFSFKLQLFANITAVNVLKSFGTIITNWNLPNIAKALAEEVSTIKSFSDLTKFLKKKMNPIVADVGMLFFQKTLGKNLKVSDAVTLITKGISLIDNVVQILGELDKSKNERSEKVIASKITAIVSDITALADPLAKLGNKNLWFLSIASAGISVISNYINTIDGEYKEKSELNKSYLLFLKAIDVEATKKLFDAALTAELKSVSEKNVDIVLKNSKLIENLGKGITAPGGPLDLIFSLATGMTNGIDKRKSCLKKYTDDGIPKEIAEHDAFVDAIATFVHDTLSGFVKGGDDVVYALVQKMFIDEKNIDENKTYIDVIANIFKILNPKNSGRSTDDKVIYTFEDRPMIYGDDGNDYIVNWGFSNVTIWGGHDNDTILSHKTDSATPQKNSIFGGPGDDEIAVADKLSTIYGGKGKDSIVMRGTNNEVFGGADNDSIYLLSEASDNIISGDTGDDLIFLSEDTKNALIKYANGDGNDTVYYFNEDDNLTISGSYTPSIVGSDVKITVGKGSILLVGAAGKNIKINGQTVKYGEEDPSAEPVSPPAFPTLPATVTSPFIYGTSKNDTIHNEKDNVVINGLGGDDYIQNYIGNYVVISSGSGNDSIYNIAPSFIDKSTTGYKVLISSGNGRDYISNYRGGNATIFGDDDDDTIHNYSGSNGIIYGGSGDDSIRNEGTNAVIDCGVGDDTVYNGVDGHFSTIFGGSGNDSIFNEHGHNVLIFGDSGDDSILNFCDCVTIRGGEGDDSIFSRGKNVVISGGKDNDEIALNVYTAQNQIIEYSIGDGDDTIYGFNSDDKLNILNSNYTSLENGNDVIIKVGNGSILLKDVKNEKIHIQTVKGGVTNPPDTVEPDTTPPDTTPPDITPSDTTPADTTPKNINNSTSKVLLSGGSGNDKINNTASFVTIKAAAGNDSIESRGSNVLINGDAGNDTVWSRSGSNSGITMNGGAGNDRLELWATKSVVDGGAGNDLIYTHAKNTTIRSGAGNDTIENWDDSSGWSNGSLVGGAGKNKIIAGAGNDSIKNFGQNTTINAGSGNDTIDLIGGYSKNNYIQYASGDGNDIITGYGSTDTIHITSGKYSTQNNGNDVIIKVDSGSIKLKDVKGKKLNIKGTKTGPSSKALTLTVTNSTKSPVTAASTVKTINASARTTAVKITGNALANSIVGGKGADTLIGGKGNDTLTGGNGADVFVYASGDGNDTITDYTAQDKISISGGSYTRSTVGNDIKLSIGSGSILVKNGKNKTLNISGSARNFIEGYWFMESSDINSSEVDTILQRDNIVSNDFKIDDEATFKKSNFIANLTHNQLEKK